ncbi:hypothetical protein HDU78_003294 [Chytriomyces hyalinus]|nr:hypothetical protein HDU78_003294 [Chytriomyces hyalinus]
MDGFGFKRRSRASVIPTGLTEMNVDASNTRGVVDTREQSREASEPQERVQNANETAMEGISEEVMVPLAAETPAIKRNRAMRDSIAPSRRESLSMRGKRLSSMNKGLTTELPHPSVPTDDFFRLVDRDLSEPMRMRQILIWCAKRIKSERLTSNDPCLTDPKVLKMYDRVISGLVNRSIDTSWYSQSANTEDSSNHVNKILKPHPENVKNLAKKAELDLELKELLAEEAAWNDILAARESNSDEQCIEFDAEELIESLTESEREMMLLAEQEIQSSNQDAEWAEDIAKSFQLQIHSRRDSLETLNRRLRFSQRDCDNLFGGLIGAYEADRLKRQQELEPMDVLRMLGGGMPAV